MSRATLKYALIAREITYYPNRCRWSSQGASGCFDIVTRVTSKLLVEC